MKDVAGSSYTGQWLSLTTALSKEWWSSKKLEVVRVTSTSGDSIHTYISNTKFITFSRPNWLCNKITSLSLNGYAQSNTLLSLSL